MALCSPIYSYAKALWEKHDAPTVIKPCLIDGQPVCYATAYVGDDDVEEFIRSEDDRTRAAAAVGFLIRASREVSEIQNTPNHPSREGL